MFVIIGHREFAGHVAEKLGVRVSPDSQTHILDHLPGVVFASQKVLALLSQVAQQVGGIGEQGDGPNQADLVAFLAQLAYRAFYDLPMEP